ncbi:CG14434 [Drosophila busckii]|uniref:CG14434 n=2 Tax=Drosophila busckii TaxID=30019 RepID=A0A0M4F978_DROBS|nr:CG14434 [Drosophila busckii]
MSDAAAAPDQRNVEIKASIPGGVEEFARRVEIAKQLTGTNGEIIKQRDVFFNSPRGGRLKLRYLEAPAPSQLVYYDRPDVAGPKLSKYNKIDVAEPGVLEKILRQSNGTLGVLAKRRLLFIHEQTRIHMDEVTDLGFFMEFEVCLRPEQTLEEGQVIADKLCQIFKIAEADLMTGSYFDALNVKIN